MAAADTPPDLAGLQRASALVDLATGIPLAVPPLAAAYVHQLLPWVQGAVGAPGTIPTFAPSHLLLVNLAGLLTVMWSTVRLREMSRALLWYDTWARVAIAALIAGYLSVGAVSPVFAAFLGVEGGFATAQLWALTRA